MKQEDMIAFIQVKLIEGWKDIDIQRAIEVPRSTYFYWNDHRSLSNQNNKNKLH